MWNEPQSTSVVAKVMKNLSGVKDKRISLEQKTYTTNHQMYESQIAFNTATAHVYMLHVQKMGLNPQAELQRCVRTCPVSKTTAYP